MKLALILALLLALPALAETPRELCNTVNTWDQEQGELCQQAARHCTVYQDRALKLCETVAHWDFKAAPACLKAISGSVYSTDRLTKCETVAIFDFPSTIQCLASRRR